MGKGEVGGMCICVSGEDGVLGKGGERSGGKRWSVREAGSIKLGKTYWSTC